jgi:hypothetical protein
MTVSGALLRKAACRRFEAKAIAALSLNNNWNFGYCTGIACELFALYS